MDLKKEVEAIERDQSFEELAVLRRVVMARVKRQQDLVEVSMSNVTTGNVIFCEYIKIMQRHFGPFHCDPAFDCFKK